MIPEIFYEEKEVLEAVKYQPCVSIILPFEPKMSVNRELDYRLQRIFENVEKELLATYPDEIVKPVTDKLKELIKKLDYTTFKQSIAIFVSPLLEKVYYLDIPVEEKIIIDESFEIRDLVYSKKDIHKYLILVLSGERSRVFLGNSTQFLRIASNTPEYITAFKRDIPERRGNFSDPSKQKEIIFEKFLRHIDNGLRIILKAYSFPLFIMGTSRTIGHFKKITHNLDRINDSIQGNFEDATDTEIRKAIAPHVADWKKVKQNDLLQQLEAALGAKKLATGIEDVWKEATYKRGRLLVAEKNYMVAAYHGESDEIIYHKDETTTTPFYIKDSVDDVIEKVLENGGDVEFVDEGVLDAYQHIALMLYS